MSNIPVTTPGKEAKEVHKPVKHRKRNRRAVQTFVREGYRTHINLLEMADRKANIMLRLNSLLITAVIIFFRNIVEYSGLSVLTLGIFLCTALASLILAALAARPHRKVTKRDKPLGPTEAAKSIFLFKHFVSMSLTDYEKALEIMARKPGAIYKGMSKDLHLLGRVIANKYRLLYISYSVFVVGLVVTVLSFLLMMIFEG